MKPAIKLSKKISKKGMLNDKEIMEKIFSIFMKKFIPLSRCSWTKKSKYVIEHNPKDCKRCKYFKKNKLK